MPTSSGIVLRGGILALWIASALLLAGSGAAAFVIDGFLVGPFTVTDPVGGSGTAGLQTGLPTAEVMGGSRQEWITIEASSGTATAHLDGGGTVALSLTNIYGRGWYQFDWDVSEPVDLTHGGVADSFQVNFSGFPNWRFPPPAVNRVNVEVFVETAGGNHYGHIPNLFVTAPGMMELPFSAIQNTGICCPDVTQTVGVTLLINFANVESGAVRVSSFGTGPEPPAPDCSDTVDNDGDGLADFPDDPGCANDADVSEHSPLLACDDGANNDSDIFTDYPADPGCAAPAFPVEDPACDDGLDNDGDGLIDFGEDPYCVTAFSLFEGSVRCGLGAELVLVLPPLMWLIRRCRRRI
jgi:hypothetical protein